MFLLHSVQKELQYMEPRTKPQNMQYLQGINASGKKDHILISSSQLSRVCTMKMCGKKLGTACCHWNRKVQLNNWNSKINWISKKKMEYECEICNRKFSTASNLLRQRIEKHSDAVVQYLCEKCGKQFPRKNNCDRHEPRKKINSG